MSDSSIQLAYISGGFPIWALMVAQHRGLFREAGLDVHITHTGSSQVQLQGLREGRFDIGLQLPDHPVRATLSGCPMAILAAQTHAPDVALVSQPQLRQIEDLRGQRVAVDGARSGYALLLRQLLRQHGLADGDVSLVEVGDSQQRVQALHSGELAASFINPPLDKGLVAQGFTRLTSTRSAFPNYPGPVAAARREWVDAHPGPTRAFQQAWGNAWQWLLDEAHTEDALALAHEHLQADPDAAQRALSALRAQGLPQLSDAALQVVIDVVAQAEGGAGAPPTPAQMRA